MHVGEMPHFAKGIPRRCLMWMIWLACQPIKIK